MRPLLSALLFMLLATSAVAAPAPTMGWLPLPPSISWHADHAAPAGAALIDRALAIVVLDLDHNTSRAGSDTFWSLRRWWISSRPIDGRQAAMILSVHSVLPRKLEDTTERIIKGQDNSGGLLRALAGNASGVVLLVNPEGRITHLRRCGGAVAFEKELDGLLPKTGGGLLPDEAQYPATCKPALELFRVADVKGALALCARKLGPAGEALAKDVVERADDLIDADLARLADVSRSASQRFITRGRLNDLLAAFPASAKADEVTKAFKKLRGDKALAAEEAAWAALQDYLVKAGKSPPKKLAEMQKESLAGIIAKFPDSYAAELAQMIRLAAQVEP